MTKVDSAVDAFEKYIRLMNGDSFVEKARACKEDFKEALEKLFDIYDRDMKKALGAICDVGNKSINKALRQFISSHERTKLALEGLTTNFDLGIDESEEIIRIARDRRESLWVDLKIAGKQREALNVWLDCMIKKERLDECIAQVRSELRKVMNDEPGRNNQDSGGLHP